ncbi:MAG: hypothetical protein JXR31_14900 [Prolixibacteraceae bacterium]|nr:hypothetical protein [Prolixibacteraceae bacterium]
MKKVLLITVIVFLAASLNVKAQSDTNEDSHSISIQIPEVALLDLEGSTSITLAPTAPTEAGNPLDFSSATNSNIWVNYSSIVATGLTRSVSAAITTGSVPAGLTLKVTAGSFSGSGQGNTGSPASQITLSSSSQNVLTGIGSCYTGNGASNGHNLTYVLALDPSQDYEDIVQGNTSITVKYTLSDDN